MSFLEPLANALALGAPSKNIVVKMIARAVAYAIAGFTIALEKADVATHAATKLYIELNSMENVFLTRGLSAGEQKSTSPVPRTYIYGPDDDMIPVNQVIQHANIAIANMSASGIDHASNFVRVEEFVGSPHVNHVKFEKDRYWRVIKETWQRSVARPAEKIVVPDGA